MQDLGSFLLGEVIVIVVLLMALQWRMVWCAVFILLFLCDLMRRSLCLTKI